MSKVDAIVAQFAPDELTHLTQRIALSDSFEAVSLIHITKDTISVQYLAKWLLNNDSQETSFAHIYISAVLLDALSHFWVN